jgi:hypothetical protein
MTLGQARIRLESLRDDTARLEDKIDTLHFESPTRQALQQELYEKEEQIEELQELILDMEHS